MDIKKPFSRHRHRRKGRKGDTAQLAAQLAPLEEQDKPAAVKQLTISRELPKDQAAAEFTGIIVDSTDLQVPQDIKEESGDKTYLGMEPVVLVILALMLAFIAFIAWQISLMPKE